MVFSSITFLYYFLPLVLIFYFAFRRKCGNAVLFAFSLLFYAWGEPVYILLMLFSTVINFFAGIILGEASSKNIKRLWLWITVAVNFLILFYFKYFGFTVNVVNSVFRTSFVVRELALPIGISFYTFQAVSYIVDVYRKNAECQKNFISFGCYITLFPQLIAGPIVRYNRIEQQLICRRETAVKFAGGVSRFVMGLGKKVIIANNIGVLWETVSAMPVKEIPLLTAWLGIAAFSLQIYFDFSGYSDMAIGLGKMFGFTFDENFDYPYISKSVSEFWRRWHISLGTWFKEYVYIPLGGSRRGRLRTIFNLLVVWMFTGLWHGAGLNFLVWGLYYAALLILEKTILFRSQEKWPVFLRRIYTLFAVVLGWVIFASPDAGFAFAYIKAMFTATAGICDNGFLYLLTSYGVLLILAIVASTPAGGKLYKKINKNGYVKMAVPFAVALLFMLCTAYLVDSTFNPFLYFRF